jgi:hypothetical protein
MPPYGSTKYMERRIYIELECNCSITEDLPEDDALRHRNM